MPMIKDVKIPATKAQSRVQAAAWTLIYGGLLTLITGYTMQKSQSATSWLTGEVLMVSGSLVTAVGAVLIYIRSLMKNADAPKKETSP
jgi:intracellular septation protein A